MWTYGVFQVIPFARMCLGILYKDIWNTVSEIYIEMTNFRTKYDKLTKGGGQ